MARKAGRAANQAVDIEEEIAPKLKVVRMLGETQQEIVTAIRQQSGEALAETALIKLAHIMSALQPSDFTLREGDNPQYMLDLSFFDGGPMDKGLSYVLDGFDPAWIRGSGHDIQFLPHGSRDKLGRAVRGSALALDTVVDELKTLSLYPQWEDGSQNPYYGKTHINTLGIGRNTTGQPMGISITVSAVNGAAGLAEACEALKERFQAHYIAPAQTVFTFLEGLTHAGLRGIQNGNGTIAIEGHMLGELRGYAEQMRHGHTLPRKLENAQIFGAYVQQFFGVNPAQSGFDQAQAAQVADWIDACLDSYEQTATHTAKRRVTLSDVTETAYRLGMRAAWQAHEAWLEQKAIEMEPYRQSIGARRHYARRDAEIGMYNLPPLDQVEGVFDRLSQLGAVTYHSGRRAGDGFFTVPQQLEELAVRMTHDPDTLTSITDELNRSREAFLASQACGDCGYEELRELALTYVRNLQTHNLASALADTLERWGMRPEGFAAFIDASRTSARLQTDTRSPAGVNGHILSVVDTERNDDLRADLASVLREYALDKRRIHGKDKDLQQYRIGENLFVGSEQRVGVA